METMVFKLVNVFSDAGVICCGGSDHIILMGDGEVNLICLYILFSILALFKASLNQKTMTKDKSIAV
jgi:hypothetical protein